MYPYRLLLISAIVMLANNLSAQVYTFIENRGQWHTNIRYAADIQGGSFYLEKNGFTYNYRDEEAYARFMHEFHERKQQTDSHTVRYHALRMKFQGAAGSPVMTGSGKAPAYHNYYLGNDPAAWAVHVPLYNQVTYHELYRGIDLKVYSTKSNLKYDYVIAAGADPSQVQFSYEGETYIHIKEGYLYIGTSLGDMVETKPYAYQWVDGRKVTVSCSYKLTELYPGKYNIGFSLGAYDRSKALIIDPILIFSTYSGSKGDNFGFTATYDNRANLYAGGITNGSGGRNYPVTSGAYQETYGGGAGLAPANLPCDITISKYDSAGTNLVFATYLGGNKDEYPHSLVVDNLDNLFVLGTTYSANFPVHKQGYDTSQNGGADIIVAKFNPFGDKLLGSTYMGGALNDGLNTNTLRYNYADDFRGDIVPDSNNHVYIASTTESSDFPILNAAQPVIGSKQDGCVFSLDSNLRKLEWSTYLGGDGDDACYSVKLNDSGVYIGGGTSSGTLAAIANGATTTFQGGRADGFFARYTDDGIFTRFSYFGTPGYDQVYFIEFDNDGKLYAAGQTEGAITRTAKTYGKDRTGQFIVRYSADLMVQDMATTIGARLHDPDFSPTAFLVDKCYNIYLSGWGSDISYDNLHGGTTANLPVSPDAIQKTTDNNDFYLIVLGKNAKSLLYATYFGGNLTEDHVDGGTSRFDKQGVVYQSVCSSCPGFNQHFNDFPVTPNAVFDTNWSPRCSNAAFKIDFQITFQVDASFTAAPKTGCGPLTVNFTNTSKKGREFFWDFGDSSPISNVRSPQHTYTKPGKYKVFLTTVDSFSCNISEMDSTVIEVLPSPDPEFDYDIRECSFLVYFKNESENSTDIEWRFGDGSSSGEDNPGHIFPSEGLYKVQLMVRHPASTCRDTIEKDVELFGNPLTSLKVPNVFTPGSDNINDCYTIEGLNPDCDEASIRVYDRWGLLIYKGDLPQQCWNGRIDNTGARVADGVYYYLLDVKKKGNNPNNHQDIHINGVIHVINH